MGATHTSEGRSFQAVARASAKALGGRAGSVLSCPGRLEPRMCRRGS